MSLYFWSLGNFSLLSVQHSDGAYSFIYDSSGAGVDSIQATYTSEDGHQVLSNIVKQRWFDPVDGTFGWAWPGLDGTQTLTWSYGGDHRYLGNVHQAATNWNDTNTGIKFVRWTGGQEEIQVRVVDAWSDGSSAWNVWLTGDTFGVAIFPADPDQPRTQITIMMYERSLDEESDTQRTKVATHELGHAIGLEHTTQVDGAKKQTHPSVMWQGRVSSSVRSTPQAVDTKRVNGLY